MTLNYPYSIKLVALDHSIDLAKSIADKLKGCELIEALHKLFPDGEVYVRIPSSLKDSVAIIIHRLYPNPNERYLELLLLTEAANALDPYRIILVLPYLAYSRQDRRFLEGEPISIKALLSSLSEVGANILLTVDVHKEHVLTYFKGLALNLYPKDEYASFIKHRYGSHDIIIIAPDKGALERAKKVAQKVSTTYDYLEKYRDRVTGEVTYKPSEVNVKDKVVVLVDDIISTGGTIAKAARILYSQGARSVNAICTHGLFVGNAIGKLKNNGVKDLATSNTIKVTSSEVIVIDIANLIAKKLINILNTIA